MDSLSPKYEINWVDVKKAVRGMVVFALAGLTLQVLLYVTDQISTGQMSFGVWNSLIVAFATIPAELIRRFLTDYSR